MKKCFFCLTLALILLLASSCNNDSKAPETPTDSVTETTLAETPSDEITTTEIVTEKAQNPINFTVITPDNTIRKLASDFSVSSYSGDYYFDDFIKEGGVSSDEELTEFLMSKIIEKNIGLMLKYAGGGCSTLSAAGSDGHRYAGHNYDWYECDGMIIVSKPNKGYKSVSTVNMDYVSYENLELSDELLRLCALYCPVDGMNEKGVFISANMISDNSGGVNQNTNKPDFTTTTAIRLVLDKATTADEAVKLLKSYDMHSSKKYMIHFAVSDASGKAYAVEYVNGQTVVTETPVLTNFYVTPGSKYGIGSEQSHTRFEIVSKALEEKETVSPEDVRDILSSVSKKNFGEFMSTEWSAVYDQIEGSVIYYHRENYDKGWKIKLR